jgi:hypothetical protein
MNSKEHFTKVLKANEGLIFKITTLYTNSVENRRDLHQEIVYQLSVNPRSSMQGLVRGETLGFHCVIGDVYVTAFRISLFP